LSPLFPVQIIEDISFNYIFININLKKRKM
jgi:hypothetical protein